MDWRLESLYRFTGAAHVIGITGPPGSGKSTLISALVEQIRSAKDVAVLAVDPSSPLTGGAVLGDRVRMMVHHADQGVFVRSMASRGRQGGLAWATAELVHLLDAAGFPVILVETVGTGQDGIDIAALAQTTVVVEAPGLGDGVQAIKSGFLEVADIVVVNKADQAGADEALRMLRTTHDLARSLVRPRTPVLATSAVQGDGISKLNSAIASHLTWLQESGELARRANAPEIEVLVALRALLHRSLAEFREIFSVLRSYRKCRQRGDDASTGSCGCRRCYPRPEDRRARHGWRSTPPPTLRLSHCRY